MESWCCAHKRMESDEDLYDFPVSNTFRNGMIATGKMPDNGYVDIETPHINDDPAFLQSLLPQQFYPVKEKPKAKPTPRTEPVIAAKPEPTILEKYGNK